MFYELSVENRKIIQSTLDKNNKRLIKTANNVERGSWKNLKIYKNGLESETNSKEILI